MSEPGGVVARAVSAGKRAGRRVTSRVVVLIAVLGFARALAYLLYALARLPYPLEVWYLEPQMVHLAWRVQAGVRMYPPWRDHPHVANFFGPVYFGIVGLAGRSTGAPLEQLFSIGRGLTFASTLSTTVLVAWLAARRYGAVAGTVGAVVALGAAPMFGFSVMVRPDLLAELLGFAGFALALARRRTAQVAACSVLAAAILTKQTAGVFVLAAVAALLFTGRRRDAAVVGAGSIGLVAAIVGFVSVALEPMFVTCLLAESRTPFDRAHWWEVVGRLARTAPDLLVFPLVGVALWMLGRPRAPDLAALAVTLVIASVATAGKLGSDLNYFVSLRIVEASAVAALWATTFQPGTRRARGVAALAAMLGAASLIPGVVFAQGEAREALEKIRFAMSPTGQASLHRHERLFVLAEDPGVRLLTNYGLLALHQHERAPFIDPWLFRMMVDTGQIHPDVLEGKIRREEYDYIVDTADWSSPRYRFEAGGLPPALFEAAREHYRFFTANLEFGVYAYVPRRRQTPRGQ